MISFIYDTQVVPQKQKPAATDGLFGRKKYVDYGDKGYRQVQTADQVGYLGTALHWITTFTGIKPAYKVTEYYCTERGRKLDLLWNELAPSAHAERISPKLSLKDCEYIQEGHPIHDLPLEILCQIFSHFDLAQMAIVSQTCKAWKWIAETEDAGLINFHLNPAHITLKGHKAGTYRDCEYAQAEGSTKVVKTISLIKEEDLKGRNFGIFFDLWNEKPGIAFRFISRSLNEKGELVESSAIMVALKNNEDAWTAKTIAASTPLYSKTENTDTGMRFLSHDPSKLFIFRHKNRSEYLKRLVSGQPCGGMIRECHSYGRQILLEEGQKEIHGKPVIQIVNNVPATSEE